MTRRTFLATTTATLAAAGCRSEHGAATRPRAGEAPGVNASPGANERGVWVNDIHSQLNRTRVADIARPTDEDAVVKLVRDAAARGTSISLCGGRHAGGGQQFRGDRTLVDLSGLDRVGAIDPTAHTVEIEAGARWPAVLNALHARGAGWSIHQKQGGADELSLGGALASNVHGRCLNSRPIVQDVAALRVVLPSGDLVTCDRERDGELFRHVIGGYGLFGVVTSLTLKLERRRKLKRYVKWIAAGEAVAWLEAQRDAGAVHGDFQFSIDPAGPDYCTAGLASWYVPVADDTPLDTATNAAADEGFLKLVGLAHADKAMAMKVYRQRLEAQDGKAVNWSDDWQRGGYVADYHAAVDTARQTGAASEVLCELHVPRPALADFLTSAARVLREDDAELIYGVVRLIERDDETALAWAREPFACVIFNLDVRLEAAAIARYAATFRRLLAEALARGGSYYLTYHRLAELAQTEACYPQLRRVLAMKRKLDPKTTLDSDWYQHYARLLG